MLTREDLERLEAERLAPYAVLSSRSRGREQEEAPDPLRMAFQRDRDRIVHSSAFRKLEYKTQVFLPLEGDYHRNRLTHTMEVAQIARSIARSLQLNEDLTEAIALAHDLGHPPFGHAGEEALGRMMVEEGGFEHNEQGLRVVERLEERYANRPGLNLTWEVREGIAKHRTAFDSPNPGRFDPGRQPSLEAQVCDLADEIAYLHHDIDDALKFQILEVEDFREVPWLWEVWETAAGEMRGRHGEDQVKFRALGVLFDRAILEVLRQTTGNLREAGIKTLDDVRRAPTPLVAFGAETAERYGRLREFLMARVYHHPRVVRNTTKAGRFIEALFELYERVPEQLPLKYQGRIPKEGLRRVVCDYIAGMTDRFCQEEYRSAFEAPLIR